MRILLVGENHRAEIRGRTIAIHGLAEALRDRGHEVCLVQAAKPEHRVQLDGIQMRYISTTRKSLYPLRFGTLSTRGWDVIHTNDEAGAYLALRSRVRRLPLVAQIQPPRVRTESFWQSNWRWRYIGVAARNAPKVLAPSQWLADEIAARYRLPAERILGIQYGLKEMWFDAFRPPDSSSGGPLRIALVNMKGVDVALRAFAKVAPERDVTLELYGVDKLLESNRELAASLGLSSRVDFRGFIPNEELVTRLAGADVLLHPARTEGFGQVLAEAAALGIPAVASRVNAIPEVVSDGETGLLCPVDDVVAFAAALSRVLSDSPMRRRLGEASRARAESRWRWARVALRIEEEIYGPLRRSCR